MATPDPTQTDPLLAHDPPRDSRDPDFTCAFCGTGIAADSDEYVEHRIPTDDGRRGRYEHCCSPSCFIRHMEQVGSIRD